MRTLITWYRSLGAISDVELDGIDTGDAPDFCDAFIIGASIKGLFGWRECTETELDRLNSDGDFVYEQVQNYLY